MTETGDGPLHGNYGPKARNAVGHVHTSLATLGCLAPAGHLPRPAGE